MRKTNERCAWRLGEEAGIAMCDPSNEEPCSAKKDDNGSEERFAPAPAPVEDYRQKLGDPGAVGFIAYGITTVLFNLSNAGLFPMNTTTAGIVIAYGGFAQVLAGIMEFVRGNTFPCTIATTFGSFWIATALVWILPHKSNNTPDEYLQEADEAFMGVFFLLWAVFTSVALASSLVQPRAIFFVFVMTLLFFVLQAVAFFSKNALMKRIAGFEGICCGLSALYCGLAMMLNDAHGKTLLPLFPPHRKLNHL
ncbi:GPR1/FUN34/yaaH family protein [Trypanosoma rangeli]|uniref:GPR1/FUN34/yaaH family protein n=1 Tax=Trypanosoma rangeli TaxID=5698 RepID=A0A3R7M294_TRYRA|nr:GPR1/FUN34/yaaH family protein [Trypanosoma rangeli]RNF07740.1 GPR1/FUN34/yaaH family protein [Trypanosoma rangeli]|eukprot:RNF07740.1 GPR1/FUN34/yaaH family protein [Trypanosoma rangeli]